MADHKPFDIVSGPPIEDNFYSDLDTEASKIAEQNPYTKLDLEAASAGFDTVSSEEKPSYTKQAIGAVAKGGMQVGKAILELPKQTAWLMANFMEIAAADPAFTSEEEILEKATLPGGYKYGLKYKKLMGEHERGVKRILETHPEWEREPSENFLDLVTDPRKLSLAVVEALPLLVGAGVVTAGGRPDLSITMMTATEGQGAKDNALEQGATEEQANTAYWAYGSVAGVIEHYLHIKPALKLSKATYNRVLTKGAREAAKQGKKSITKEFIIPIIEETIEEPLQGAWEEWVAASTYGAPIAEGGIGAYIDRRAQEALIAGVTALIPGIGGEVAGRGKKLSISHKLEKAGLSKDHAKIVTEEVSQGKPVKEALNIAFAMPATEVVEPVPVAKPVEPVVEEPAKPEKERKPYKSQYVAGHEIPKILGMKEKARRKMMKKETGKTSMAKMTPSQAQDYIDALHKLAREKGVETGMFPSEREFKKPIIGLTPQLYKAKILGVEFMTKPAAIGKQEFDIEFAEQAKQVEKMEQVINRLGGETRRTRAAAKLKNKPTKSVAKFADLLNKYEEAPAELSKEETDVFNYFRNLNRAIIARENVVRKELKMDPIVYKPGYMRHIVDTLALDVMEGRHPIPEEIKYWAEKNATKKIRNPMEFQRKLGDELEEVFSNDIIKATKAMLWTGLKEVHLNKPLKFFEGQMGLHSEVIPDSTRRWAEKFINQMIIGKQAAVDSRLDEWVRESGIGKVIDKVLRPFGRRISRRPLTRLMSKAGRLQIYGVMGWRPKQLIRNKFQILQNLALYTTKANLKSFLTASEQLKEMMSESLFLKTYKGFEDLREVDKRVLGKWWLAPFQWTAVSNARRAMKVSYWDTLELIENRKYKDLGWADPERTYTEEKEFLYPSEKKKLLAEMEFGAGVTQYHYIPMAMPGVFNYKAATPLTRLQSWWMNYFFKFHRESAHRFFKGETREGLKLPWSRRIGWARYMVIGGLILNTLGYSSSYLFGAAPEAIPPLAQLLISMYKYVVVEDEKARASAKRKFLNALKTFIPGYLAKKDISVLLESEDWTQLLFYKKGIFAEEPEAAPTGRRKARRVRPRKVRARRVG